MKLNYGMGILVVVLLSAAVGLLGILGAQGTVSLGMLLAGAWTFLAAFVIVEEAERSYYIGWGIIIAGLSLSYLVPIQDALAVIIVAMVALILVTAYRAKKPKVPAVAAGTSTPAAPEAAS